VSERDAIIDELLALVPPEQRAAAYEVVCEYGLGMAAMAHEEAAAYLARIQRGDMEAVRTVLMAGGWEAVAAASSANLARWERVLETNMRAAQLTTDALAKVAPVVAAILMALFRL